MQSGTHTHTLSFIYIDYLENKINMLSKINGNNLNWKIYSISISYKSILTINNFEKKIKLCFI